MYSNDQSDLFAKWLVSNSSRDDMASFIFAVLLHLTQFDHCLFLTEKKGLQFHKEYQLDPTKLRLYISNNNDNVWDFLLWAILFWFYKVFNLFPMECISFDVFVLKLKNLFWTAFPQYGLVGL